VTFQSLISDLGEVQNQKYNVRYLDPTVAKQREDEARKRDDMAQVYEWNVRPLAASGHAIVVGGGIDNDRFSFKPESPREGFERLFGKEEMLERSEISAGHLQLSRRLRIHSKGGS